MTNNLYSQLCSVDNLQAAWLEIKSKKTGGGIDAVSVEDFELNANENILRLSAQLKAENYTPLPTQKLKIKKSNGEARELGLLSIRDKIVQRSTKNLIEPIIEKNFINASYAYRPKKGATRAIKRLLHYIKHEHYTWFAIVDIDNCFDSIPVDQLLTNLKETIRDNKIVHLIELWLRMGKVSSSLKWQDTMGGIPQGAILSPLLTNLYLNKLDKLIQRKKNVGYLRYADDILLACHSKKEAHILLNTTKQFLNDVLKLKLNSKLQFVHIKKDFSYLGINFNNGNPTLSKEKEAKIKLRINNAFDITEKKPGKNFLEKLNGIKAYYGQILSSADVANLDQMLIDCLKSKLREAYALKKIASKKDIKTFILSVPFFSNENESEKNKIATEIAETCILRKNTANTPTVKIAKSVLERKREYQKLESAAMELVVSTPGVILGKAKNFVTVKKQGKVVKQVNAYNLRSITIASAGIGLSSNMIKFCSDQNITLNFLNYNGKPYAMLTSPKFAYAKNEIIQLKALQSPKGVLWIKAVLKGKIKNQQNTLKFFSRQRKRTDPDFMTHLPAALEKMQHCLEKLKKVNDNLPIEKVRETLFAIEGQCAQIYWQQVGRILDDYILFEKRIHQGATDLFNSMLNYGYAILYGKVWHAVMNARMNPCIGILHVSDTTNAAFIYDMVEEFRSAIVDRVVISLVSKGENLMIEEGQLDASTKKRLLNKLLERFNKVEKFRKSEKRSVDIIQNQVISSRRFFANEISTYKPYIKTW
ncbi:MAG: CRISPR-associated endonuclease Cas1 [Marinifilaceae bacterium]